MIVPLLLLLIVADILVLVSLYRPTRSGILSDRDLLRIYDQLIPDAPDRDLDLINPASLDIRIGFTIIREGINGKEDIGQEGVSLRPGAWALVSTYERIHVPNGYVVELKLKSSTARKGWNHMLAFHVDPGWDGVLTMEVKNELQFSELLLKPGERFAQIIVHRMASKALNPYTGHYQGAKAVQGSKL